MPEYLSSKKRKQSIGINSYSEYTDTTKIIGNVLVGFGSVGVGTTVPTQDVDVNTIRVRDTLFDYTNSGGEFGYYLVKDTDGIKWVAVPPIDSNAIFVAENNNILGVSSFTGLNIIADELLSVTPNPINPNFADITILPRWLKSGDTGIYTTKNVGIGTTIPTTDFQVGFGTTGVTIDGSVGVVSALGYYGNYAFIDKITVNDQLNVVGLGSTLVAAFLASAGGITTTGGDLYVGGSLFADKLDIINLKVVNIEATGITTLNVGIVSTFRVTGVSTLGVTSTKDLFVDANLKVSGITTLGITSTKDLFVDENLYVVGIATATRFSTGATGSAINITSNTISGPAEIIIDPAGVGDDSGIVRIKGDLYVDGEEFIVNSTTIELADFNVGIASTVGTNLLLDGAGIGIGSTNIRKTLTYDFSSDALKSSENFDLETGKVYKINETEVLSSTQLTVANINATGVSTLGFATIGQLYVSGVSTFVGVGTFIEDLYVGRNLYVADDIFFDELNARNANITGITTLNVGIVSSLTVTGVSTLGVTSISQLYVSGVSTFVGVGTFINDLYVGEVLYADVVTGLTSTTDLLVDGDLRVTGITTLGVTSISQLYVSGITTLGVATISQLNVSGVTTLGVTSTKDLFVDANLEVSGITTLGVTSATNLTSQQLNVSGITTLGITTLQQLYVSGVSTFVGVGTFSDDLYVGGILYADTVSFDSIQVENIEATGISTLNVGIVSSLTVTGLSTLGVTSTTDLLADGNLVVTGVSTFVGFSTFNNSVIIQDNLLVSGVSTFVGVGTFIEDLYVGRNLYVADDIFFDELNARNANITGIATLNVGIVSSLTVTGLSTLGVTSISQLYVSGITTLGVTSTKDLFVDANLEVSGISTLGVTSISQLYVSGIATLGITSTTNLTSQQLNVSGILTASRIVGTSLSITGISTLGVTSTTNLTTQQLLVTGITTLRSIVGTSLSISGISTIANFIMTPVGTGATVGGIGVVTYYGDGSGLTKINPSALSGIVTYADRAGIATNVIGGIGSISQLQVTGISTFTNGPILVGSATSTGTALQRLQVTGGAYVSGNLGIGTTTPKSKLTVVGDGNFTGVVTATTFIGNLTGTATTASSVTENSVGLGTDTFGDYVKDITGTANEIIVTAGTGEGSSPTLSIPNQFTAPEDVTVSRDLQVNRNLNVNGNITIGGTAATLFTQTFKVADADIILGVRTDGNGNDISTDNTANHGGIAIASTEGNPLIILTNPGIGETLPATYKKIMWFKEGSFAGLGTDAWLSNYALGVGTTELQAGTVLAAGSVQFSKDDLKIVRNINASGIITATEFKGTLTGYASSAGIATNLNGGPGVVYQYTTGITSFVDNPIVNDKVLIWKDGVPVWGSVSAGSITGTTGYADKAGIATYADNAGIATNLKGGLTGNIPYQLNTGITTFVDNPLVNDKVLIWKDGVPVWGSVNTGSLVGVVTYADRAGIATNVIGGIASVSQLNVSGISTLGVTSTTNLTSQQLLVTGITTLRSIVGTSLSITGISTIANFIMTPVGTGATVGGIGVVTYYGDGSGLTKINLSSVVGVVTYADRAGIATNVIGGIASVTSLDVSGITTLRSIVGTSLSITGISTLGVTSTTNLTSQQLNVTGITTLRSIVGTSLSISGISTLGITSTTNLTSQQLNVTGITTLRSIVGTSLSITGISTIANFIMTPVGTGATVGGIGVVTYYGDGSGLTKINPSALSGIVTYADRAGIATNVIGGIGSITQLQVSGISTFTNGPILVGSATSTGTSLQRLQVTGGAYVSGVGVATGSIGVGITNPQGTIDIRTAPQWSIFNLGANLIIGGSRNNGIGILDSTNSNPWSISNSNGGNLVFSQMPALGNTASAPTEAARITTNRNLLIGAITETGTTLQRLQVTGGAYVSGNLGIGTTTPTSKLTVVGDTNVSGVVTAFDFYNTAEYPNVRPTLDLAFAQTKILDSRITFTRASTATYVGFDGLIKTAAVNEPRFDHNPTTGESLGLLVEEQRTNSITNNTMVGAVAGTPGTNPTNWLFVSVPAGITREIIGVGTESGIIYIDYRFSGTTTNANGINIAPGNGAALTGQTWNASTYWKLAGGSTAGISAFNIGIIEETSGGVFVTGAFYGQTAPTSAPLISQRPTATRTLTGGATVAQVRHTLQLPIPTSTAINIALRIGLPQLEEGAFATSVIPTNNTAPSGVTRSADVASITGSAFSGWYRQGEGTMFGSYMGVANITSGATRRLVEIGESGQTDNRIILGYNSTSASRLLVVFSGTTQADINPATTQGALVNAAAAFATDNFQHGVNGNLGTADTSGSVPSVVEMRIGSDFVLTSGTALNGTIRRITYWTKRLPNAQLQTITL